MRLFDALWDLPKPEEKKKVQLKRKIPMRDRVEWTPITPMQGKQTFGVRYFSRRFGMEVQYAIARDPSTMDGSWMELKNPPKDCSLEMGKDPETKKTVCRMVLLGVDCGHYILGRLNEMNKNASV